MPIATNPATNVSPSEGRNIQVAMPPIAARISAYSESEAGAGVKLSNTSRHAIAPVNPIAPIVCRNFINRRIAQSRWPPQSQRAGSTLHDLVIKLLIDDPDRVVDLGIGYAELMRNQLHEQVYPLDERRPIGHRARCR